MGMGYIMGHGNVVKSREWGKSWDIGMQ